MKNVAAGFSPSLMLVLTNESQPEPNPTDIAALPSQYMRKVIRNIDRIRPLTAENFKMLRCNHCGRKGKYDIGMIAFDIDRYYKDVKRKQKSGVSIDEYIQTTGYFRCRHCHSAGNWEFPTDFMFVMTTMLLMRTVKMENQGFHFGPLSLFDGSRHRFATDAEEYLLKKIQTQEDSLHWNKLGNLYNKGGRPELATVAFEQSVRLDPTQAESHFSLGQILDQMGEFEMAAAREGEVPVNIQEEEARVELDMIPDKVESFFPVAEMYMGERRKEMPRGIRTLDKYFKPELSYPTPMNKKKKKRK
ncbi:tetratricopeptide repeat protein [Fodinisporobacter ferrooxydans]|uniref:Tetratricopeptide repeat protein n=1 Tax=Fodinisporobacter ferrooxydans TaxID=2901836 RepID=A0ABY4CMG6_9BACL|nr:tetratricopeptide repeat protein [Alicyclobacillaceae bacterium MYW30-H2]